MTARSCYHSHCWLHSVWIRRLLILLSTEFLILESTLLGDGQQHILREPREWYAWDRRDIEVITCFDKIIYKNMDLNSPTTMLPLQKTKTTNASITENSGPKLQSNLSLLSHTSSANLSTSSKMPASISAYKRHSTVNCKIHKQSSTWYLLVVSYPHRGWSSQKDLQLRNYDTRCARECLWLSTVSRQWPMKVAGQEWQSHWATEAAPSFSKLSVLFLCCWSVLKASGFPATRFRRMLECCKPSASWVNLQSDSPLNAVPWESSSLVSLILESIGRLRKSSTPTDVTNIVHMTFVCRNMIATAANCT